MQENEKKHQNFTEIIPRRDSQTILLSAGYFWLKYLRRQINLEDFQLDVPEVDLNDPIEILRVGFDLHRQANRDIENDASGKISELLIKHPKRRELFDQLSDEEIKDICYSLNEMFENQEFCAQCECWSYYEDPPEEFAIRAASDMLLCCDHVGEIKTRWFGKIEGWKERDAVIKGVLIELFPRGIAGLLNPVETELHSNSK